MRADGHRSVQREWRPVPIGLVVLVIAACARGVTAGDSGELEALQRQVVYLTESLASSRAQVDALKARLDRCEFDTVSGSDAGAAAQPIEIGQKEYRILEFNRELGMVIVNAGRRQGVRPGLQFAVMRKDKVAATVKVVDVRETIAGAVLQRASGGELRPQDRAVLMSGARE